MAISANLASTFLCGAVLCFLAATALAIVELTRGNRHARTPTLLLMATGFVLQTLYLHYQGEMRGRCPITTLPEILIFLSWSTVLLYFMVGQAFHLSLLGVFTAPLVAGFTLIGLAGGAVTKIPTPPLNPVDPWLEAHASVSIISYGAFTLATVAATMFLVQHKLLKSRKLTQLFYNLPSVNYLAKALKRLIVIGFALLSIGIATAFLLHTFPGWSKILLASSVWLAYGALLLVDRCRRMSPRDLARASLWLFALPIITLGLLGRS